MRFLTSSFFVGVFCNTPLKAQVKKEKMKYPGNVLCVLYSGDGDRLPVYNIADSQHTGIARARGEATENCLFQELNFRDYIELETQNDAVANMTDVQTMVDILA